MAEETQYTPNTGMQTISTTNSALDGSGTLSAAIITGASNGTLIKTVTVKAQATTSEGMVRLFVFDGTNTKLIHEIEVDPVTKSSTSPAFEKSVTLNFKLKNGWSLKASTEIGSQPFNVIVEGQNWAYYGASVRAETTKYSAYNAATTISTANTLLDGTGTMGTALASSGCNIWSVTIKAKVTTSDGMVRLFLYDGTNVKLLTEIPVKATTQSGTVPTFYHKVRFTNGFALKTGWQLRASTEIGQAINIIAESTDWAYPA